MTSTKHSLVVSASVVFALSLLAGCELVTHPGTFNIQECATNGDCLRARGDNFICRKSDKVCVGLLSNECQTVLGSVQDDDAVVMGALFALTGTNASFGRAELNGLELAFNDFRTSANGLPPVPGSTNRRSIGVVVCDDAASNDVATRSATHLVKDLEVPVIVGPTWSGVTVNVLTKITLPAGALVIASGTTSPDFTNLEKGKLFFRTVESMSLETKGLALLVRDAEARIRTKLAIAPTESIKLAIAFKGDSYGKGSTQAAVQNMILNGKPALDPANQPYFKQINYGNPGDPVSDPLRYPEAAAALVELGPHIIVPIGTNEIFGNIMAVAEQQWNKPYRPYWVYPHTGLVAALVDYLKTSDPKGDVRKRVFGVTYGSAGPTYEQFRVNYASQVKDGSSPDSVDASTSYDAFYVAAFAIASVRGAPITGRSIADGIANLVPPAPTKIQIGPNDLNTALMKLAAGEKIDIDGASGPLDFNLETGDVEQEAQVWCVPLGPDGQPAPPTLSGYGFDLALNPISTFSRVEATCGIQ